MDFYVQKHVTFLFLLVTLFLSASEKTTQKQIPRTVLALFDSASEGQSHDIEDYLEMPLNFLGLNVKYHDIQKGIPNNVAVEDLVGIVTWFDATTKIPEIDDYVRWVIQLIDQGKKYIIIYDTGFYNEEQYVDLNLLEQLWHRLGFRYGDQWINQTNLTEFIYSDPFLAKFEYRLDNEKPSYPIITQIEPKHHKSSVKSNPKSKQVKEICEIPSHENSHIAAADQKKVIRTTSSKVKSHLIARWNKSPNYDSDLVVTGPNGGCIATNYAIFGISTDKGYFRKWIVNPFTFFTSALQLKNIPIPDPTTIAGNRVYYSQIDGDGWNNMTYVEGFNEAGYLCPDVIYQLILLPNPDLPVTVGPIGAELDLDWFGTSKGRNTAKKMFELPNVQVGCHTFTHPFDWPFFDHYTREKELPYLKKMPQKHGNKPVEFYGDESGGLSSASATDQNALEEGYTIPRAYGLKPFNLDQEVFGAIALINSLSPPNKKVNLYQWSGNALPNDKAIGLVYEAKVNNINGGESRFDNVYNSYSWLSPLGRTPGDHLQVYSSSCNEIYYTSEWNKNYYGLLCVIDTYKNTGIPIRTSPMDLYYHIFSGSREGGISAVQQIINYVRTQKCIPLSASDFSAYVMGFVSTRFDQVDADSWQIMQRGQLQTIRFDKSSSRSVDFGKSQGVIGQKHLHGSLYVYLDESIESPIITLKDNESFFEEPAGVIPYLIESRWRVSNMNQNWPKEMGFRTEGFGQCEMCWRMPEEGDYHILVERKNGEQERFKSNAPNGRLKITLPSSKIEPITVKIEQFSHLTSESSEKQQRKK